MKLEYAINHQEAIIQSVQGRYKAIQVLYSNKIKRLNADLKKALEARDKAQSTFEAAMSSYDACLSNTGPTTACYIPKFILDRYNASVGAYQNAILQVDNVRRRALNTKERAISKYDSKLERAKAKLNELKDQRGLGVWFTKNGIRVEYNINHQEAVIDGISGQKDCVVANIDAYLGRLDLKTAYYQEKLDGLAAEIEGAEGTYQQCTTSRGGGSSAQ
jgi:flagellar biosynthesis chaperone FliJ